MVISTFFIQDVAFHDPDLREDFATAMLDHNHYLFSGNEDDNSKVSYIVSMVFNLTTFVDLDRYLAIPIHIADIRYALQLHCWSCSDFLVG